MEFKRDKNESVVYKTEKYRLKHAYYPDSNSDVLVLIIDDSIYYDEPQKYAMPCMKNTLSAACDFFKTMFESGSKWSEGNADNTDEHGTPVVELKIDDLYLDHDVLLRYFGSLQCTENSHFTINDRNCLQIWRIAQYFQDQSLINCVKKNADSKKMKFRTLLSLSATTDDFNNKIVKEYDTLCSKAKEIGFVISSKGGTSKHCCKSKHVIKYETCEYKSINTLL